ncbi:MAG TPA: hypothetical protein VJH68_00315 [Candidatus Nanoarchaeia archaeon]|nr:hypothetical protein [Candidatus Nanoarchaeia archaeon]
MRDSLKIIRISAGIIGTMLLGYKGYYLTGNNSSGEKLAYEIERSGYQIELHTTGLPGFVEFTRFPDGSQEVKIYPRFPTKSFNRELHQDLNGDGLVDRIMCNGAEWKIDQSGELLIRKQDYDAHRERFNEADRQLQKLVVRYQRYRAKK